MNQKMRKVLFPVLTGGSGGLLSVGSMAAVFWFFTWLLPVLPNMSSTFFIITELFFMGLAGLSVMIGAEWLCREKLSCKGRRFDAFLVLGTAAALLLLVFLIRKGWPDFGADETAPVVMWFFAVILSVGLTGYLLLWRWIERLKMKPPKAYRRRYLAVVLCYLPLYVGVWMVLAIAAFILRRFI